MGHHHHHHHHAEGLTGRRLGLAIWLTLAFVAGEWIAGVLSHSLALVSDAGHNLSDVLCLVFSWYALQSARRPSNASRTFGYHRIGILAALVNAVSLLGIAVWIFWEAVERLRDPEPVASGPMIGVALMAVALNTVISLWLRAEAKHDLNIRSAYLHQVGDAASAFGVVIAGVIIHFTGSPLADPVVSLLIGTMILWSSWGILSEAVNVLLEGVPVGLDMEALERSIGEVPGVLNVHDLHVWSVASGIHACSCHIMVAEQSVSSGQGVLRGVAELLKREYHITHTTVQIEVEGCDPNDIYCTLRALRPAAGEGHSCSGQH